MISTLDMALIGNGQVSALVDAQGEIVWCCLPRYDGDPTFCSLLQEHTSGGGHVYCVIELVDQVLSEQAFVGSFEGKNLDASMLLLHDDGFLSADDPQFVSASTGTPPFKEFA